MVPERTNRRGATLQPPVRKESRGQKAKLVRPKQTRVLAVCNQKGGCGKTTTVINLAGCLAELGFRVLVVDMDAQCNSTSGLGFDQSDIDKSVCDMLLDPKRVSLEDIVIETSYPGLHLAPGGLDLAEFDIRAAAEIGRENRLKRALQSLPEGFYDFVLLDTPPSLGLLLVNALNAATEVQITMQAHPFAFEGLNKLLETIDAVREELNPPLVVRGVIVTMFDGRTRLSRDIVNSLHSVDGVRGLVHSTVIRQNIRLAEAARAKKPVVAFDSGSTGASDYRMLCREIIRQHYVDSPGTVHRSSAITGGSL